MSDTAGETGGEMGKVGGIGTSGDTVFATGRALHLRKLL